MNRIVLFTLLIALLLGVGCNHSAYVQGVVSDVRITYDNGYDPVPFPVLGAQVRAGSQSMASSAVNTAVVDPRQRVILPVAGCRIVACSFVVTLREGRKLTFKVGPGIMGSTDEMDKATTLRDGDVVTIFSRSEDSTYWWGDYVKTR